MAEKMVPQDVDRWEILVWLVREGEGLCGGAIQPQAFGLHIAR